MKIKNIAKKSAEVLPFTGFLMSVAKHDDTFSSALKSAGHLIYTIAFGFYLYAGGTFGIWTPNQYLQHKEKLKIEAVQKEQYKQKLFGENGYANKDDIPKISPSEKFEVYKRIGLEDRVVFPELSLENLEKAVKSYEADN